MDTRTVVSVLRASAVVLLALILPSSAAADRHKASFGGGGSRSTGSSLYGILITGDWTLKEGPKSPPKHDPKASDLFAHDAWTFSVAGEVSQVAGTHEGSNFSRTAILAGPRFTLNQIGGVWRFEPFVEALIGPVYQRYLDGTTDIGGSFGGGIDVPFGKLTSTEHHPLVVARVQYGWHWVGDAASTTYHQWSVGLVFRLTKKKN